LETFKCGTIVSKVSGARFRVSLRVKLLGLYAGFISTQVG